MELHEQIVGAVRSIMAETDQGDWVTLFDGKTTQGWRTVKGRPITPQSWTVIDGCLVSDGVEHDDLLSTTSYRDFELSFQWRFYGAGRTMVGYAVDDRGLIQGSYMAPFGGYYAPYVSGFAWVLAVFFAIVLILGKVRLRNAILLLVLIPGAALIWWYRDINNRVNPARGNRVLSVTITSEAGSDKWPSVWAVWDAGAISRMLAPTKRANLRSAGFNEARVVMSGAHVEHWINGERVLEYTLDSREFNTPLMAEEAPWLVTKTKGPVLLEHTRNGWSPVWLRNIRIRQLSPDSP